MRRGVVRHSRGKYAGSVSDFTEVLRLDPNDKQAIKLRAHSAAKEREVRLALRLMVDAHNFPNECILQKLHRLVMPTLKVVQNIFLLAGMDGRSASYGRTVCPCTPY